MKKKKFSSSNSSMRLSTVRTIVKPITSDLFRNNHIIYCDDSRASIAIENAGNRDVETSTVILVDRKAANDLKSIVKYWSIPNSTAQTGTVYTSHCTFNVIEWSADGRKEKEAHIKYSMVKDNNPNRQGSWIIHHLDGTDEYNSLGSKQEWELDRQEEADYSSDDSELNDY